MHHEKPAKDQKNATQILHVHKLTRTENINWEESKKNKKSVGKLDKSK
jgi:hypothetical protein